MEGFEPSVGVKPTHAFQACALNRSATSPIRWRKICIIPLRQQQAQLKKEIWILGACKNTIIFKSIAVSRSGYPAMGAKLFRLGKTEQNMKERAQEDSNLRPMVPQTIALSSWAMGA